MSKATRPMTEPNISCGFYDSFGGDRKYYASQMSRIFDGIITDGIFSSIGDCMRVKASSGNNVEVSVGKCWFDHTFTEVDAPYQIDCGDYSSNSWDRIDVIYVETDSTDAVRDNFIKFTPGDPFDPEKDQPIKPELIRSDKINQYPLCYIYRVGGSASIRDADIEDVVGTETPFVTNKVLDAVELATTLRRWQDELDRFVENEEKELGYITDEMKVWLNNQKNSILGWYDDLKTEMDGDVAVNLQFQIDRAEVENILVNGFIDGTKTFSKDGTVITTVDTKGRKLVKTFTNNFLTSVTELTDEHGGYVAKLTKTISPDGKEITTKFDSVKFESAVSGLPSETWSFELDDGTTIEKEVVVKE